MWLGFIDCISAGTTEGQTPYIQAHYMMLKTENVNPGVCLAFQPSVMAENGIISGGYSIGDESSWSAGPLR